MYDPTARLREPRLLTEQQAAQVLGVSTKTMQRMRKEGRAPDYVRIGRQLRYSPAALNRYLQAKARSEMV